MPATLRWSVAALDKRGANLELQKSSWDTVDVGGNIGISFLCRRFKIAPPSACLPLRSHVFSTRFIVLTLTLNLLSRPCYLGTGKSTTIYHVIESRVQKDARVLITSIRNQAIDAVTEKVDSFGVLVSCVVLGYENQASSTVCLGASSRGISGVSTNACAPGVVEAFTRGLRSRGQSA